ncbi:MAG TPA: cupredoxin domain-containing protein [Alloacidobacterium sp.]|nr:cupredoxin domain-containing protein [Alloacidobacterium sp.]
MVKASALAALIMLGVLPSVTSSLRAQEAGRTIEIHAKRFSFEPAEITVKKGETVTLHLISDDVPHSLLIKDLGINQEVRKNHPADVTFTADKVGDFHGRCGRFCGSGHGAMVFIVHVTPD